MSSDWLKALFAYIDAKDVDGFLSYFAHDATFRFGNADTHVGVSDIGGAVEGFLTSIAESAHDVRTVWEAPGSIACHGDVTYTRLDESSITLPFANVLYLDDDGKISEYLIHIDITPLH